MSVRARLTLSYAGFLVLTGAVLLTAGYFSLSRGVHPGVLFLVRSHADLWRSFAPVAVLVLAFLLVVGLVGGWFLAGRMLAPLDRITEATRTAATGSLSHRIAMAGPHDEFRELADAFDAMLARLEAHVAEQQRFAANASHELRTPLAITQTLLDVARREPDREDLIERLRTVNTRAIDLTEALLVLSRADQRAFQTQTVDLALLAEEATETLAPLATEHGVAIETTGDAALVPGSPELLLQLCTNLVHNAIVHNLAPGTVTVTTGAGARLVVENTGPPIDPEVVATLHEPFRRGTDRVGSGVGLGLAIVRSIALAHDGTLDIAPRPGGGLRVIVTLPPARVRDERLAEQGARDGRLLGLRVPLDAERESA